MYISGNLEGTRYISFFEGIQDRYYVHDRVLILAQKYSVLRCVLFV